ncbi:hypothetical protein QUH73_20565, partial [Labilibaculum sp. K2S]|uniref:hypothetical protein n=1 Tax=Labilibaculum sp. K2S TaxID=3056386 RepID=UPI0025A46AD5
GATTYQWYRANDAAGTGEAAISGATAATYLAVAADLDKFLTVAITPVATSGILTGLPAKPAYIGIIPNMTAIATGTGTFRGKTCFDIALGNDGINSCTTVSNRASKKADFTLTATNTQSYKFTPIGTVSNVRFYYSNTNGAPITAISGNNTGNNISAAVTATVSYDHTLNTLAAGLTRLTALTANIYVVYNATADNSGADNALQLPVNIKDCSCCGAMISPTEYKEFMCYNLGANTSLNPFVANIGLLGDYYEWGRAVPTVASDLSMYTDWLTSSPALTTWGEGPKKPADPCPAGFRLPTEAEMLGVRNYNDYCRSGNWTDSQTAVTSLFGVGGSTIARSYLTFPAASSVYNQSGVVMRSNGDNAVRAWVSTVRYDNTPYNIYYWFANSSGNSNVSYTGYSEQAMTVRCIEE